MSRRRIAEKWNEYGIRQGIYELPPEVRGELRRAFFAGATAFGASAEEAGWKTSAIVEIRDEIHADHAERRAAAKAGDRR